MILYWFPYIKSAIAQKVVQHNGDVSALILHEEGSQVGSS